MAKSDAIQVANYKNFRALKITCAKFIYKNDVLKAFASVNKILDEVSVPICVIIDLRNNSFMPITETFHAMLTGPHIHPNLDSWLVIGESIFARYVVNMLERANTNKHIQWFENESEVIKYLKWDCLYA